MRLAFALVYLLPAAFAVWSIVRLFRDRDREPGSVVQWQRGFGWIALCTAPFAPLQILRSMLGMARYSFDAPEALLAWPASWYVLFGGRTVVAVFEANVEAWTGHRRDTMLDNAWVFLALTGVQVLVLSLIVLWRFRAGRTLRDPVVLAVGAFAAVNAALAMTWPWFGT